MPTTQLQIEANQKNAQHSTGPKTEGGKAKSSLNALRTGLTGRTLLLSADEADLYEHHVARYACEFNPVGDREHELVQLLADTQWRINSIPNLEAAVYATGRTCNADLFEDETPAVRRYLVDAHVYLTYHRELKNLHIQETRLRRNYAKDLAELTALQAQRAETAVPKAARAESRGGRQWLRICKGNGSSSRTGHHVRTGAQRRAKGNGTTAVCLDGGLVLSSTSSYCPRKNLTLRIVTKPSISL